MTKRKTQMPRVGDLVLLRWVDIHENPQWGASDDHGVTTCESVGWVVKVSTTLVTMTRTYGTDHGSTEREPGDAITFPRGCITGFEVLRAASPAPTPAA